MRVCSVIRKSLRRARRSVVYILNHPIAKKDKFNALKRYVLFHLVGRLLPGPAQFSYVGNVKFLARPGLAGIVGNIYMGLEDFEEMGFLLHFLREGDLFVDVGANVGAYTLLASGVCKAKSIAIEPIPTTFELLMANLYINDLLYLVEPVRVGMGSSESMLYFTAGEDVLNRVILDERKGNSILVNVTTLDNLLREREPLCVKIDVEGWEFEVIRGANKTLNNDSLKAIIVELHGHEHRYSFSYEDVHRVLAEHNFSPFAYNPFTRKLQLLENFNHQKFNTLYVRDIGMVEQRVREAPVIKVLGEEF